MVMKYRLRKLGEYGYTVDCINECANEKGLVVTYAYVHNVLIAILGETKVKSSDYVVMQRDRGGIYAYNRGIPVRRVIMETNTYSPKIVDDLRSITIDGFIDVYVIG